MIIQILSSCSSLVHVIDCKHSKKIQAPLIPHGPQATLIPILSRGVAAVPPSPSACLYRLLLLDLGNALLALLHH